MKNKYIKLSLILFTILLIGCDDSTDTVIQNIQQQPRDERLNGGWKKDKLDELNSPNTPNVRFFNLITGEETVTNTKNNTSNTFLWYTDKPIEGVNYSIGTLYEAEKKNNHSLDEFSHYYKIINDTILNISTQKCFDIKDKATIQWIRWIRD